MFCWALRAQRKFVLRIEADASVYRTRGSIIQSLRWLSSIRRGPNGNAALLRYREYRQCSPMAARNGLGE